MPRWKLTFHGRKVGAIGIFYTMSVIVEAVDVEAAWLKLYDTHEHIQRLQYEPINPSEETR